METSTVAHSQRYDFLDWLRVLAIFVLLFYHTGMIFVGWGWHIENTEVIASLQFPMDLAHRLRMPLLFIIAGAGLWFALDRRSGREVVRERSLRLLLPLVAAMFLIVPPQIWYERLFRGQWQGGYVGFYVERVLQFQPYPQGDFSWHHLWFVAYLYIYVLLLMPLLLKWRNRPLNVRPGAWLYALSAPLALNEMLLKPRFPESHNLIADWYVFNHYLLLTLYGFVLASMPGIWDWLVRRRHQSLSIAVAVIVIAMTLLSTDLMVPDTPFDAIVANIFTWCWLLVFIGYGRQHLSFSNGLLRWARDASYPIYILHQTIIVAVGYYVIRMPWSPWVKYWVVLSGAILASAVVYESTVRRFALMRLLFGMKSAARVSTRRRKRHLSRQAQEPQETTFDSLPTSDRVPTSDRDALSKSSPGK